MVASEVEAGSGEPSIESSPLFLLGVSLAVVGNTLIACSLTLQKYCNNREAATGVKASSTPLFWVALIGMIAGEVGNFTAFGFASQTVVSPLGAVSVIVNTILAACFLKEKIYPLTIGGILLTLLGASLVVLFSPPPLADLTCEQFLKYLEKPEAYGYLIVVVAAIVVLGLAEPRWGHRIVLVDVMLCSLLGSITVICSTALSKFIRLALDQDKSTILSPIPYILIPILVATAVLQLKFLNRAMANFNSAVVVPTYYVTFTLSSIAGGMWVFNESFRSTWITPVPKQEYFFFLGSFLCFGGVVCIAAKPAADKLPAGARGTGTRNRTDNSQEEDHPGGAGGGADDDARVVPLRRAATFGGRSAEVRASLTRTLSAVAASFTAPSDGLGSGPLPPVGEVDLRGSVNVVTGVGTMQQLHHALSSWSASSATATAAEGVESARTRLAEPFAPVSEDRVSESHLGVAVD